MTKRLKLIICALIMFPLIIYLAYQYNVNRLRELGREYSSGYYTGIQKIDFFNLDDDLLSVFGN